MSNFDHFVGTRPVSDQHAFDTEALTAWLARNMEGFVGHTEQANLRVRRYGRRNVPYGQPAEAG